jgi:flagellar motility protein MotE (MotC chaperone)
MEEEEKKEKKGKKGGLIVFIIFIFIIGGFITLVKLDIFGLGTEIIGPSIQEIPVINMILPEMPEEEPSEYAFATIEEAVESLTETENSLKELQEEAEKLNEEIATLEAENIRLSEFEENQVQFEEEKAQFDQDVADQVGDEAYMAYVESAFPENALSIYETLVVEKIYNEEVVTIANMYAEMNAQEAADILEETTNTNMEMVSNILLNVEPSQAGAILAAMDPTTADKISRYMYPDN